MLKYLAVAKILKKHKPKVDSTVLHLHYRITFLIFFISSLLVTAKEYFGDPISCMTKGTVPASILNIYCFITSTFSVPRHWAKPLGDGAIYPGTGNWNDLDDEDEIVYHAYYQWVPLMLFLQAILFYMPHYIWKLAEGGLFRTVLGDLNKPTMDIKSRQKKHKELGHYMVNNLNMHTLWAWRFFMCEVLAFINVVGNLYFTDRFLGGTFLAYGSDVIKFQDMQPEERVDPMMRIFPTIAKCTFRNFGSSGTVEVHDTMCILAINILNQKIYILLWFWMVGLAAITGVWLVFRIATICSSDLRGYMLQYRGRMAGKEHLRIIKARCNLGDWFMLYSLGRELEPTVFAECLRELSNELENLPKNREGGPILDS